MKTVSRLSFLIGLTACIAFSQGPKSAIQFYDSSSQNKTVQFGWTGTKDAGHFFVELPDGKSMTLTNGNLAVPGNVTATGKFSGDGSGLTSIDSSKVTGLSAALSLKANSTTLFDSLRRKADTSWVKTRISSASGVTSISGLMPITVNSSTGTPQIGLNPIDSTKITTGGISSASIRDNSIRAIDLGDTCVSTTKIKDLAVTGAKIANATITDANIANISGSKINPVFATDVTMPNNGKLIFPNFNNSLKMGLQCVVNSVDFQKYFWIGKWTLAGSFGGISFISKDDNDVYNNETAIFGKVYIHGDGTKFISSLNIGSGSSAVAGGLNITYDANNGIISATAGDLKLKSGTGNAYMEANRILTTADGTSDRRFKKEVRSLDSSLSKIENIDPISFSWKADDFPERHFDDNRHFGVIAQDIQKILPEIVGKDQEGYLYVEYDKLTPVLIGAIKEQQKIIESQNERIRVLEKKMLNLGQ